MTLAEIRKALHRGAQLRMPRFEQEWGTQQRVAALEDHLNATAVARGELEEARLYASSAVHELSGQWDAIEGWEVALRKNYTQEDVRRAKRDIRPDLHEALREARFLVARVGDQIHRLEQDDTVASRLYSIVTGA